MFWCNENGTVSIGEGLALRAVSLLLALILWITILGFKKEKLDLSVKLEPLLAPGMMITSPIPSAIHFQLTGSRILLKDVEKKVHAYQPDFRRSPETTFAFSISEELLGKLPVGIRVASYSPSTVLIRLEEVVERYILVKPRVIGRVAEGYEITSIRAEPSKIAVLGPKSTLEALETIPTKSFNVEGLRGSKEGNAEIEVEEERGFQLSRDKEVRIVVSTRQVLGKK